MNRHFLRSQDAATTGTAPLLATQLDGLTPVQSWTEDQVAVREVPLQKLRCMLLPDVEQKIGARGVQLHRLKYLTSELVALMGETVVIRAMPHDESSIGVYRGEEFVCTATVAQEPSAAWSPPVREANNEDKERA